LETYFPHSDGSLPPFCRYFTVILIVVFVSFSPAFSLPRSRFHSFLLKFSSPPESSRRNLGSNLRAELEMRDYAPKSTSPNVITIGNMEDGTANEKHVWEEKKNRKTNN